MTAPPLNTPVSAAAVKLIQAVALRRKQAQRLALADADAGQVARVTAAIAADLGARVYGSRAAFLAELQRAVNVLDSPGEN